MKSNQRILLALALVLVGATLQKSGVIRKLVYLVHDADCSVLEHVIDNQCGNAICIFSKENGEFECMTEKTMDKFLLPKEEMVDQNQQ